MKIWWLMLFCNAITPLIMVFAGWMMWKHPPQDINGAIGYRTRRSMKNMDTWRFAHNYCGRLWWKLGWILLVLTLLAQAFTHGASQETAGILGTAWMGIQLICLTASILPTEIALKNAFTDEGVQK